ncbi:unnamed protein product [Pleuronectes platessa]|uniref:Uncharacterized protein n=1 Tax=Pleuronectes platessa TaxID=8262 RepID=A0A9N7TR51_PLEPL|nr:unnamed protein product [Pleuronectes platessa]
MLVCISLPSAQHSPLTDWLRQLLLLLSKAWPVQSKAECLLFYSHCALPGSLLKGILAFSSRLGCWELAGGAQHFLQGDEEKWVTEHSRCQVEVWRKEMERGLTSKPQGAEYSGKPVTQMGEESFM